MYIDAIANLVTAKSSMNPTLFWFAALLLFSNAALITLQQEQSPVLSWCFNSAGNYTPNSLYETNLRRTLLPSLASNATINFTTYYNTAVGRDPDRIFGFAQCMSASSVDGCRTCLNRSATEITNRCPNRIQAFIRYEDCTLRYSNRTFVSQLDTSVYIHYRNNANATEPALFSRQLGSLLRNLSKESAQSPSRFAAGSTMYTDLSNIYGMIQCTREISRNDFITRLEQIFNRLDNWVRARFYFPSCTVRYEIYASYPADGLTPPPSQPSSPPPLIPNEASPPPAESSSDPSNRCEQGMLHILLFFDYIFRS